MVSYNKNYTVSILNILKSELNHASISKYHLQKIEYVAGAYEKILTFVIPQLIVTIHVVKKKFLIEHTCNVLPSFLFEKFIADL